MKFIAQNAKECTRRYRQRKPHDSEGTDKPYGESAVSHMQFQLEVAPVR